MYYYFFLCVYIHYHDASESVQLLLFLYENAPPAILLGDDSLPRGLGALGLLPLHLRGDATLGGVEGLVGGIGGEEGDGSAPAAGEGRRGAMRVLRKGWKGS